MKTYTLRTSEPDLNDPNYNYPKNPCLRISNTHCLPNCVGYVFGAWLEMFGAHRLPATDARTFYGHWVDGYKRSQTPKLGAIACWNGEHGHVAIVVGIHSDHITVAQSNYGGTYFEVVNCYRMSTGGYKSHAGNTKFQGFIYPPDGFVYADRPMESNETIAREVIQGKWGNGSIRRIRLTNAGYNYTVIQSIVNAMMSGTDIKSVSELAREVIQGKWGNGADRKKRLTDAGYDYAEVQKEVNRLCR